MLSVILISNSEAAADIKRLIQAPQDNFMQEGVKLGEYLRALQGGIRSAKLTIGTNAVQATGTITLSSFVATDTITINGVVFTCVASGATGNQFNVGGSDTLTAAAAAAAINASVTALVSGYVTATSATNVITITTVKPGLLGNMCTLAISAHGSVSGAKLTGGTDGATERSYKFGSGV